MRPAGPRSVVLRWTFATAVLLAAALSVLYWQTRSQSAPGQDPLTDLASMGVLREQFNQDVGEARLILLASPT